MAGQKVDDIRVGLGLSLGELQNDASQAKKALDGLTTPREIPISIKVKLTGKEGEEAARAIRTNVQTALKSLKKDGTFDITPKLSRRTIADMRKELRGELARNPVDFPIKVKLTKTDAAGIRSDIERGIGVVRIGFDWYWVNGPPQGGAAGGPSHGGPPGGGPHGGGGSPTGGAGGPSGPTAPTTSGQSQRAQRSAANKAAHAAQRSPSQAASDAKARGEAPPPQQPAQQPRADGRNARGQFTSRSAAPATQSPTRGFDQVQGTVTPAQRTSARAAGRIGSHPDTQRILAGKEPATQETINRIAKDTGTAPSTVQRQINAASQPPPEAPVHQGSRVRNAPRKQTTPSTVEATPPASTGAASVAGVVTGGSSRWTPAPEPNVRGRASRRGGFRTGGAPRGFGDPGEPMEPAAVARRDRNQQIAEDRAQAQRADQALDRRIGADPAHAEVLNALRDFGHDPVKLASISPVAAIALLEAERDIAGAGAVLRDVRTGRPATPQLRRRVRSGRKRTRRMGSPRATFDLEERDDQGRRTGRTDPKKLSAFVEQATVSAVSSASAIARDPNVVLKTGAGKGKGKRNVRPKNVSTPEAVRKQIEKGITADVQTPSLVEALNAAQREGMTVEDVLESMKHQDPTLASAGVMALDPEIQPQRREDTRRKVTKEKTRPSTTSAQPGVDYVPPGARTVGVAGAGIFHSTDSKFPTIMQMKESGASDEMIVDALGLGPKQGVPKPPRFRKRGDITGLAGGGPVWYRGGTSTYRDLWTPGSGRVHPLAEGPMSTLGAGLYLTDEQHAWEYAKYRAGHRGGGDPIVGRARVTAKNILELDERGNLPPAIAGAWGDRLREMRRNGEFKASSDWLLRALYSRSLDGLEKGYGGTGRNNAYAGIGSFQRPFSAFLQGKGFDALTGMEGGEGSVSDHPSMVVFDPKRHVRPFAGGGFLRVFKGGDISNDTFDFKSPDGMFGGDASYVSSFPHIAEGYALGKNIGTNPYARYQLAEQHGVDPEYVFAKQRERRHARGMVHEGTMLRSSVVFPSNHGYDGNWQGAAKAAAAIRARGAAAAGWVGGREITVYEPDRIIRRLAGPKGPLPMANGGILSAAGGISFRKTTPTPLTVDDLADSLPFGAIDLTGFHPKNAQAVLESLQGLGQRFPFTARHILGVGSAPTEWFDQMLQPQNRTSNRPGVPYGVTLPAGSGMSSIMLNSNVFSNPDMGKNAKSLLRADPAAIVAHEFGHAWDAANAWAPSNALVRSGLKPVSEYAKNSAHEGLAELFTKAWSKDHELTEPEWRLMMTGGFKFANGGGVRSGGLLARMLAATTTGTTITPGMEARSQQLNALLGIARGGTPESGGAMLPDSTPAPMSAAADRRLRFLQGKAEGGWIPAFGRGGAYPMYHGTPGRPFSAFDPRRFKTEGLFGPAAYLTSDTDMGRTYTGEGRKGTLLKTRVRPGTRLLHVENPRHHQMLQREMAQVVDFIDPGRGPLFQQYAKDRMEDADLSGRPELRGYRLYEAFSDVASDLSAATQLGERTIHEELQHQLRKKGYAGFAHTGGTYLGGRKHKVNVIWDTDRLEPLKKAPKDPRRAKFLFGQEKMMWEYLEDLEGELPFMGGMNPGSQADLQARVAFLRDMKAKGAMWTTATLHEGKPRDGRPYLAGAGVWHDVKGNVFSDGSALDRTVGRSTFSSDDRTEAKHLQYLKGVFQRRGFKFAGGGRVSPWVQRAMSGQLPASDRTGAIMARQHAPHWASGQLPPLADHPGAILAGERGPEPYSTPLGVTMLGQHGPEVVVPRVGGFVVANHKQGGARLADRWRQLALRRMDEMEQRADGGGELPKLGIMCPFNKAPGSDKCFHESKTVAEASDHVRSAHGVGAGAPAAPAATGGRNRRGASPTPDVINLPGPSTAPSGPRTGAIPTLRARRGGYTMAQPPTLRFGFQSQAQASAAAVQAGTAAMYNAPAPLRVIVLNWPTSLTQPGAAPAQPVGGGGAAPAQPGVRARQPRNQQQAASPVTAQTPPGPGANTPVPPTLPSPKATPIQQQRSFSTALTSLDAIRNRLEQVRIGVSDDLQLTPVRALSVSVGQQFQEMFGGRRDIRERARIATFEANRAARFASQQERRQAALEEQRAVLREMSANPQSYTAAQKMAARDEFIKRREARNLAVGQTEAATLRSEIVRSGEANVARANPGREAEIAGLAAQLRAENTDVNKPTGGVLQRGNVMKAQVLGVAGIVGGTVLFSTAMAAAQAGIQTFSKVVGSAVEAMTNFAGTTTRVTSDLAGGVQGRGMLASSDLAGQFAQAGISGALITRLADVAQRQAGAQNFLRQSDMLRSERNLGARGGMDLMGTFQGFGNGPLAGVPGLGWIGQTPGIVERFSDDLRTPANAAVINNLATQGMFGSVSQQPSGDLIGDLIRSARLSANFLGNTLSGQTENAGVNTGFILGTDRNNMLRPGSDLAAARAANAPFIANVNQQAAKAGYSGQLTELEGPALDQSLAGLAAIGPETADFVAQLRALGLGLKTATGALPTADQWKSYWSAVDRGANIPTVQEVLTQLTPAFTAQARTIQRNRAFTEQVQIPTQFASQLLANPLSASPTRGIFSESTGMLGSQYGGQPAALDPAQLDTYIAQIGATRDELNTLRDEGVQTMLDLGVPKSTIDSVANLGVEIRDLRGQADDLQLGYQTAQYNRQLYLAKRSLSDIVGLQGKSNAITAAGTVAASKMGELQRAQLQDEREMARIQLARSRREIEFNLALSRLSTPGATAEERATRRAEAEAIAREQRRMLDIQERSTFRGFQIQDIGIDRDARDAIFAIKDLQAQQGLQIQLRGIEKLIEAKTQMLQVKQAYLDTAVEAGLSLRRLAVDAQGRIEEATGDFTGTYADELETVFGLIVKNSVSAYNDFIKQTGVPTADQQGGDSPQSRGNYASGTSGFRVSTPTRFTAGEAGTEEVLVLRNPRSGMLAGATGPAWDGSGAAPVSLVVNFNGPVNVRSDEDLDRIARQVERTINERAALLGVTGRG